MHIVGARAEVRIDKGYAHTIPETFGAHAWAFLQCFNMSNRGSKARPPSPRIIAS
jgi:hypothetical protein